MSNSKKILDTLSYIGFCIFNFFIVSTTIYYLYTISETPSTFGLILILLFGLGWLWRMMKYDIEKEEINNLRRKK